MPYKDPERQAKAQREWCAKRRAEWLAANGPCVRCGSADDLQVDHKDPGAKVSHRIWSWKPDRAGCREGAVSLTVGSLFSGIGGLDLGLERAGFSVRWQVEKDDYCRRVLAKHWPNVERFEDVRDVGAHNLAPVDLICGGFPCQDISDAGRKAGIEGARSGLWAEYARIVRELRPSYVLVENVAALASRGLHRVLGDLAESGYDAEWDCIPAAAVGAPHIRDRVFIVAYPNARGRIRARAAQGPPHAGPDRWYDTRRSGSLSDASIFGHNDGWGIGCPSGRSETGGFGPWLVEPDVGRVANGVPARVDRLRGLGNAVVPQVAEWIGRRLSELRVSEHSPKESGAPELDPKGGV